ncbi:MAG: HFX_2341 family transcriptional regulator domain-containing protein [Candidatus Helarchaeota archaeon]
MSNTQFVFVGHHKEKLLASIKALQEYPSKKLILIVGEPVTSGEFKARRIARELKKEFQLIWDVEERRIDKKNVFNATKQLIDLILQEQNAGSNVIINATGSLRIFSIAAYIASCCTKSRMITSIPMYDELDNEVGIEEIIELPLIPIEYPTEEQKKILLGIKNEKILLKDLITHLNSTIINQKEKLQKERSRISHHLSNLEEMNLIKRNKVGKNIRISLTFLGKIMAKILAAQQDFK